MKDKTQRENPDWKQWVPFYGIYQIMKDEQEGKPSVRDNMKSIQYWGSSIYHGVLTISPIVIAITKGLEQIFK
ncbi:hypothetical protein A3K82_02070 [Candidatus Pacearchaeota archaeon RBG_19FT_COMBO_34_9]|nr:MAG: hypothetical protein A3K82_02070 [Candidatus Pacearchaeota archaeon RBG_19FT_COMBO_34_9]